MFLNQNNTPVKFVLFFIILIFTVNCNKKFKEKLEPSFQSISKHIFIKKCSLYTCHSNAYAEKSGQLDLSDKNAYYRLVNVKSIMYPDIMRIKPYEPDESLLIQRLEGKAIVSVPLERSSVSKQEIEVIKEWIRNGASL